MRYFLAILCLSPLFLSGCQKSNTVDGANSSVLQEGLLTEANQQKLARATPPPTFEHSLERDNLVRRLKELNVQNKVMYIYLLSWDGKVISYDVVSGKVSSLNSLLTTPTQIVRVSLSGGGYTYQQLPSPDFDGSYGKNPEGIFWFTPDGAYREWSGPYLLSSRPMTVNTPISLTATVDLEKKK